MVTIRVLWMVAMVAGLNLVGGPVMGAESQVVNFQAQVETGNQQASATQQQQEGVFVVSVVSGWGMATIDGQQVPFEPGTVLHIPNGVPFSIEAEEGELVTKVESMTISEDLSKK
jgi:mannose-6-phosphate isomerase-like protein (cupin superfamily)